MNEVSGFNNAPPSISTLIMAEAGTCYATYIILFFSFFTFSSFLIYFSSCPQHLCSTPALVSLLTSFQCRVQSSSAVRLTHHMLPSAPKSVHRKWKKYIFSLCEEPDFDISMTIPTLNTKTSHLNKERCKSCSLQQLDESSKVFRI